uniref:Uncharacterized protein n=1 Tax=Solanum lycopersicum TaxID=4081 RepID=A0A3Q7GUJ3_SOLLC
MNLINKFQSFHIGQKLGDELGVPFHKSQSHPAALTTQRYRVSKKELLKGCSAREFLLMKRNTFICIFKILLNANLAVNKIFCSTFQLIIMAFIITTLILRTELHKNKARDAGVYLGALLLQ